MNDGTPSIGLSAHRALLPDTFVPLAELGTTSSPEAVAAFGFSGAWVAGEVSQLTEKAARLALADAHLEARDIDAVLSVSALPQAHQRASSVPDAPAGQAAFCIKPVGCSSLRRTQTL
jgi:hypothetical protein